MGPHRSNIFLDRIVGDQVFFYTDLERNSAASVPLPP
jgi:hypothetical protein